MRNGGGASEKGGSVGRKNDYNQASESLGSWICKILRDAKQALST